MNTTYPAAGAMMDANPSADTATDDRRRGCGHRRHGPRRFTPLRIAAVAIGFILFWPIGLALLVWFLWGGRLRSSPSFRSIAGRIRSVSSDPPAWMMREPGNSALAAYLAREQQRLAAEKQKLDALVEAFEAFKLAERRSADQRDFDAFLRQRQAPTDAAAPAPAAGAGSVPRDDAAPPSADDAGSPRKP